MKQKGVSPVIATVLLIVLVVVIAAIIFVALRGLQQEVITKFGVDASTYCSQVDLIISASGSEISVNNVGNVAVYKLNIRDSNGDITPCLVEVSEGRSVIKECTVGEVALPVLLGKNEEGADAEYVCDDIEINIL